MTKDETTNLFKERINRRFSELFIAEGDSYKPYVCLICDEFVKPSDLTTINIDTLKKHSDLFSDEGLSADTLNPALRSQYTYTDRTGDISCPSWLQTLILSPRASYLRCNLNRYSTGHREGLSCCKTCREQIWVNILPRWAIANNNFVGQCPNVLTALTEVEVAFLTPVKTYGYCISYTGGARTQLKGSLSYYKVDHTSIARSVAHFDALGITNNIVIIFYGNFTPEQAEKANKLRKIRPAYIRMALFWLIENNTEWRDRNINIESIVRNLRNPVLVNNSREVDSVDSNVENTDTFEVFFPDGTLSSTNGGQKNIDEYRDLIRAATQNGYDLRIRCDLSRQACADFRDNNLVNACLLQFPYGRGGIHEDRLNADGSYRDNVDISDYIQHLSRLSLPQFHTDHFTLIMYNMRMKEIMVRSAGFRVRNTMDATSISKELRMSDVHEALRSKIHGTNTANRNGIRFVNALDAVAGSLPHTNESAKRARMDGEALQHHFGLPTYFLTVTPDDENSFLVQNYLQNFIDDETLVELADDSDLASRAKQRKHIRLKYPGVCALFFDDMLDIIIEEILGYDSKTMKKKEGFEALFSDVIAFTISIEEQGRGTLHAHIQIWIRHFNKIREDIHSSDRHVSNSAKAFIASHFDERAECKLVETTDDSYIQEKWMSYYFPHDDCTVQTRKRKAPFVVDDQQLRNLRHRLNDKHMFAYCPHCTKTWTNEEFIACYLLNKGVVPELQLYPDTEAKRLKAMCIEYQKGTNALDPVITRAAYNHHVHTPSSCHGMKGHVTKTETKQLQKRKGKSKYLDECRYRVPQRPRKRTCIRKASRMKVDWYGWDGTKTERYIREAVIHRNKYDAFQNISCPSISQSKMTCNTNLSLLMPGPVGQYSFKYNLKNTQKDDVAKYEALLKATTDSLSRVREDTRTDRSEAIRRILRSSFAHLSTNVVGAPLASFINTHGSRFLFSHKTVWCPIRDLKVMLTEKRGTATLSYNGNDPFFQNMSLNYICRPSELERWSAKEFYEKFEVVRMNKKNKDDLLSFMNTPEYRHPSYRESEDKFLSGVRDRDENRLIKVHQYSFPDTMTFEGNIMDSSVTITEPMEEYSELALILFYPFRHIDDLLINGSYVLRFREAVTEGIIKEDDLNFLQNLQDTKSNSWRSMLTEDDLQSCTNIFEPPKDCDDDDNASEAESLNGENLDYMLDILMSDNTFNDDFEGRPTSLNVKRLKMKGQFQCGFTNLAKMNESGASDDSPLIEVENVGQQNTQQPKQRNIRSGQNPSRKDLIKIIASKTTRRSQSFEQITRRRRENSILPANGSARSIVEWAKCAELDRKQRRAFEVILGTFVLSFFSDATNNIARTPLSADYQRQWRLLRELVERDQRNSDQLLCFLHGPGGSGKTTVIDLVMLYAKEYCGYMDGYNFTERTIVVTAMTGVAATILLGDTTHRSCLLNQKKPITAEQIEAWNDTRLLIIDEISFMEQKDLKKLHKRLRILKQEMTLPYGGMNIIFSGDLRQLEPVGRGKKPLYKTYCPEFHGWMNCYIELDGLHRFRDDPFWGRLLRRFRNGEATEQDIDIINSRLVKKTTRPEELPENIRYATFRNSDRDAINTALFHERCKRQMKEKGESMDTVVIFSTQLQIKDAKDKFVKFKNRTMFWSECGEDELDFGQSSQRMDPALKLYKGCRLMLTDNKNVSQGEANGTQVLLRRVVLKPGESAFKLELNDNVVTKGVMASQVSFLEVEHCNDRIKPSVFRVVPEQHSFKLKVPQKYTEGEKRFVSMRAFQIPLVVTNATTGHKLQGASVDNLFVHNWVYVTNWVYVMLSRVRTKAGLFSRNPLSKDMSKYRMPETLNRLITTFRDTISITYWEDSDYDIFFDRT